MDALLKTVCGAGGDARRGQRSGMVLPSRTDAASWSGRTTVDV
jgi:hypothetical protein